MNFELTEDQKIIRSTVRNFAQNEINPVAKKLDPDEEFSVELTNRMGELGLFGMFLPEKYGGSGLDTLSYITAVEELARIDSSQAATLAAHNSLGIGPILNYGSDEQKDRLLNELSSGMALWGFGLTEPNAGSDSKGTETKAVKSGSNWTINGSKIFITNASSSITLGSTIQTITGKNEDGNKEYTCFLVNNDFPGFTQIEMKDKMVWRSSNTSELFFVDCIVPEENILGEIGQGSKIMLKTLDEGRLSIAAMGLGLAQGAFELARSYSKQREQFGRPLFKFQAISFKLADMATKIELARSLLYKACRMKDSGQRFAKEAAMAKLYCSEIAKEVADEAVQIHGGYGLMKEYPIERFYRDQRLLQIGEGTSEIMRLVISRHVMEE